MACPELPGVGADGREDISEDGVEGDGADTFIPLSLERIVESIGEPEGGERVTIYGTGFTQGAKVFFGEGQGTNLLVLDDTRINVNTPAYTPGTLVDVSVELLDEQRETLQDAYLFKGPLEIESITPAVGSVEGGVDVEIKGAGFSNKTRVFIGGRMLFFPERINGTTIRGKLPPQPNGQSGLVDVVVTNAFEQRVLDRAFRYIDDLRVDWVFPTHGTVAGGTEVTIYGTGLDMDTAVSFGTTVAERVIPGSGGSVRVRTPPGVHGVTDISIVTSQQSTVLNDAYFYFDEQVIGGDLALTAASPAKGSAAGGTQVALSVFNAGSDVAVSFNGEPADIIERRLSEGLVVVATPPGDIGVAEIQVTSGGETASRSDIFSYERDLSITSINPSNGSIAGGERVVIRGTGFTNSTRVFMGGIEVDADRDNSTTLEVVTGGGAPGAVDVKVVDEDREDVLPRGFEYRSPNAEFWAVSPGQGSQAGNRVVRIFGEGFAGRQMNVTFGDQPATEVRVIDDGQAVVRAPRGEVGHVNVKVGNLGLIAMPYAYFDPSARFGGTSGGGIPEALNVTVLNIVDGSPVPDAFVILWDDLDTPYQALTDDRGQVTFSDLGFAAPQMVTASADNFTTASIVEFDARDATLLLIPLVSAPPAPGGPGPGPQPLPNSDLAGKVSGLDKYIVIPPGNCDSKEVVAGSTMCQPCLETTDCDGAGSFCTPLGDQGSRCTVACTDSGQCPDGYVCAGVGAPQSQCLPQPGERTARCELTQQDIFSGINGPQLPVFTNDEGVFDINSAPGEYAIVCMGGYRDIDTDEFVPLMMGVRRHVFAQAGALIGQQDVRLDIPLNRNLPIRLDDAPLNDEATELHTVDVFLDLGADGVYLMPSRGSALNTNDFLLKHFPARFEESLYDASYTIYARAVRNVPDAEQNGEGSFVVMRDITEVDDDSVFEIVDGGVQFNSTGIVHDVFAMHGPGNNRVWAVGAKGQIIAWDGTWWGLQQAPTQQNLRGVWAGNINGGDVVWAVGDNGAVVTWDGLRWAEVEPLTNSPLVGTVNWRDVTGVGNDVWLISDDGVFRWDGTDVTQVILDVTGGRIQDIHSDGPGSAWIVGTNGLIRHWTDSGPIEVHDVPGGDFYSIHGVAGDDLWAVGQAGRIAHYNGSTWFDYRPIALRDLRSVHAADDDTVWAVGESGAVMGWDGIAWSLHAEVPHADLRGVWTTADGRALTAGQHTVVVGPFMQLARPSNPTVTGALLEAAPGVPDLELSWTTDPGEDASFTYIELQALSDGGGAFPFWNLMVEGKRNSVPLPDMMAAWGLQSIWTGPGAMQYIRVYKPDFSINRYDRTVLTEYVWQSWSVRGLAVEWP